MGGYERDSQPAFLPFGPAGLDAIPPDFNGRLLEDDWDRFAEITENSKIRVPVMDEAKITKLINGPEAFTPDNEFCLGESEVRGFFVAAGFCAHGLAGAGGIGRVIAEWIAEGEPSLDLWEMDVRRFGAQYRSPVVHPRPHPRDVRDLLRHPLSEPRALRRAAAADLGRERLASRPRRRVRREVGLGAGQLVRVQRRRRRRVAAAARLGGPALVAGDRRRAPRHPRGGRDLRRELVREAGDRGPGRGGACSSASATTASPATSGRSPTRRCSTSAAGSSATSPSPGSGRELFQIVTGTAFGNHDREWIRKHLPEDGSAHGPRRHLGLVVLRDLGPAGARACSRR